MVEAQPSATEDAAPRGRCPEQGRPRSGIGAHGHAFANGPSSSVCWSCKQLNRCSATQRGASPRPAARLHRHALAPAARREQRACQERERDSGRQRRASGRPPRRRAAPTLERSARAAPLCGCQCCDGHRRHAQNSLWPGARFTCQSSRATAAAIARACSCLRGGACERCCRFAPQHARPASLLQPTALQAFFYKHTPIAFML